MKLLRVQIDSAETCGGLLDEFALALRPASTDYFGFDPLCFVGPNGTGKSQLMQVIAEIFQSAIHACAKEEERRETNPRLGFEIEYLIRLPGKHKPEHVRISRKSSGRQKLRLVIERRIGLEWVTCDSEDEGTRGLLPSKVVGYTSGDNETLSLPFLNSRSGYAEEVGRVAFGGPSDESSVTDTRLMLIDYGTHLEVLVANLLLGTAAERSALLANAMVADIHSFRCIVQLNHSAAPKVSPQRASVSGRKGVQLTRELENYLEWLRRCSTCHNYDEKTETYTFDVRVCEETRKGFRSFWSSAFELYSSLHKLAMLNDLAISKSARERVRKDIVARRFAARLSEPQDEDKVFRFERVSFVSNRGHHVVDYVSLSDGEHQITEILGMFCMLSFPNVLFLLDEPESHLNPSWRVKFISGIRNLPTANGKRSGTSDAAEQDCILTTHAPFVPSDMPREKVFIFAKEKGKAFARNPDTETFGTNFDDILQMCFDVYPPISELPRKKISKLMKSENEQEIAEGIQKLGNSVEKAFVADKLRQLKKKGKS